MGGSVAVGVLLFAAYRYHCYGKYGRFKKAGRVVMDEGYEETKDGGGRDFRFVTSNSGDPSPTALVLPPIKPF